jgi:hypothetical protein
LQSFQKTQVDISHLASIFYGFTSVSPTNDLHCIERNSVLAETARALRNEMKNSGAEIREKQEKQMKITTTVKTSMITLALGVAFMLPATARAQSDVSPDEFAFSAPQTTAAQPAQSAAKQIAKADFQGKVSLPFNVKCGTKYLKAGQYSLSVKSEEGARVVTINGSGENVNIHMREVLTNRWASQSALLVGKSSKGRRLEAVYVEGLNAMLYPDTNPNGSHARTERLPIS